MTAQRDKDAAIRFLRRAIDASDGPDQVNKVSIDTGGANKAGTEAYGDVV